MHAEGRGAEVLKELLERVVEAALGQVEGGDEVNADEIPESDNQSTEEKVMGERRDDNVEEKTGNASQTVDVGKVDEGGKDITAPMEEAPAVLETGGTEKEEARFIMESPVTQSIQEVVREIIGVSEGTKQSTEIEEARQGQIQVEMFQREVTVEGNTQESESMPNDGKVAANIDSDMETEIMSYPSHLSAEGERKMTLTSTDNYEIVSTHTVEGELQEEENIMKDAEEQELEDDQGILAIQGEAAETIDEEHRAIEGAEGGERYIQGVTEELVPMVNETVDDQLTGEHTSLENLPKNNKKDEGEECF